MGGVIWQSKKDVNIHLCGRLGHVSREKYMLGGACTWSQACAIGLCGCT